MKHLQTAVGTSIDAPTSTGLALNGRGSRSPARQDLFLESLKTSCPLAVADLISTAVGVGVAFALAALFGVSLFPGLIAAFTLLAVIQVMSFALLGLYPATAMTPVEELKYGSIALTAVFGTLVMTLAWCGLLTAGGAALFAVAWFVSIFMSGVLRPIARSICARTDWWGQRAVVFGEGPAAQSLFEALRANRRQGIRPVAIVPENKWEARSDLSPVSWGVRVIEPLDERGIEELSYAFDIPNLLIVHPSRTTVQELWYPAFASVGVSGVRVRNRLLMLVPRLVKRAFDFAAALLLITLLSPLFLVLAVLVRLSSRGPIFYGQKRLGRDGRTFKAWKFRTMVPDADERLRVYLAEDEDARREWESNQKLFHDPRVTRVGKILRRTSLDEVPQIFNTLVGDMSLVGPRPIVTGEIEKYAGCYPLYQQVRPGITGLWQISGRNLTTYPQRVGLDAYYVRNWSPWFDFFILIKTIRVVLRCEGAC